MITRQLLPVLSNGGFLELLHIKRKYRFQKAAEDGLGAEEQARTAHLLEETSKERASNFLHAFLEIAGWREESDFITVLEDLVPTMEELVAYGELSEKEGTRACRRLFKAVLIWDKIGHSLWLNLRETFNYKQEEARREVASAAASIINTPSTPEEFMTPEPETTRVARGSFWKRLSLNSHADTTSTAPSSNLARSSTNRSKIGYEFFTYDGAQTMMRRNTESFGHFEEIIPTTKPQVALSRTMAKGYASAASRVFGERPLPLQQRWRANTL